MRRTQAQSTNVIPRFELPRIPFRSVLAWMWPWLRPRTLEDDVAEHLECRKWTDSSERDISYGIMNDHHRY